MSAMGMRKPVDVSTWLTLMTRVRGVMAAANRSTMARMVSPGRIGIVSMAAPNLRAR